MEPEAKEQHQQIAFTIGVIALSAKMAKADGTVTQNEFEAFQEVFHVPEHEFKNVQRVFNLAQQDVAGYEGYAAQIANMFPDNPGVLEDLLDGLFHIAKADGVIHSGELIFLARVAEIFSFSPLDFERIKAGHLGPDGSDPYVILAMDHTASDAEIKKRYRTLVKEHHPDALAAQGVPEEFRELAHEKISAINGAYGRIRKERGFK
jgi:DnaJ like chaperone protein